MDCALAGNLRASPSGPPRQAPCGVGCDPRPSREHERPAPRLRVRSFPAIIDPAGSTTSADFSTASNALSDVAVPHHPANQEDGASGTPVEISASKTSNLHRTPTAFTERPLDDIGLRLVVQTRPDRPAFYAQPISDRDGHQMRHVFLGSRFRLRLPSHPASRLSSCPRLVVGAINLHRGLAPPSCWSCRAHTVHAVLPHTALRRSSPPAFGFTSPRPVRTWRDDGSVEVDQPEAVR